MTTQYRAAFDAELENDPSYRQELVEEIIERAQSEGSHVGHRWRCLLDLYADGDITYEQFNSEIVRPFLQ